MTSHRLPKSSIFTPLGGVQPEQMAAAIGALLLLNYLSWLALPASPMPLICIVAVAVAIVGYLVRDLGQYRYMLPLAFSLGFFLLFFGPPTDWDARSVWFFHAKRMYFDGSIAARLDDYPGWAHTSYPDFMPAAAASVARLFGVWNEFLPKIALVLTLVPPFLVLTSRCEKPGLRLLMLGSLLYLTRAHLLGGSMDAHLALYTVSVIVLLREAFAAREGKAKVDSITPALVLLFCMASIKNEGTAMAALLLVPMTILIFQECHATARTVRLFAVALLASLPAAIWKFMLSSAKITALFVGDPWARAASRLANGEWTAIVESLLDATRTPLIVLLLLSLLMGKLERLALYFVLGFLAMLFVVYLATPYDLTWHLSASVDRVTRVVKLLVAVVLVLEFQRFLSRLERKGLGAVQAL
jgi:hypothetical protein